MSNIIAEIGLNHGGDLGIARTLIKQASDAGCWGVKFQFRDIACFYQQKDEVGDVMIYEEIKRNFVTTKDLGQLASYAKELNIKFGLSFFRVVDIGQVEELLPFIDFFKIPSAECFNRELLLELQKRRKKIFVSTGGHETSAVVKYLYDYREEIAVLHCISNYPTLLGTQDMATIKNYKKSGFVDVGYSSHDSEWEVCLIALSQGANWIERHITLSKEMNGLDHSSSSIFTEFNQLVRFSNAFNSILGNSNHLPNQGELINLQNLGTSLYANRNIKIGEKTSAKDYELKAPRIGISSGVFSDNYHMKAIQKNLKKGQPLLKKHFSDLTEEINSEVKCFAQRNMIGLPVRLHDYSLMRKRFEVNTYEFHLSYTEALSGDFKKTVTSINSEENISIHLPDYIPGNRLLDPVSRDEEIRTLSRQLIENVSLFANKIEDKIAKKVNIIGSFSQGRHDERKPNLEEIYEFIDVTNKNILPQWLPVFAWYFGGAVELKLFNSLEDINYIRSNACKICLDVSHLVMASSFYNADWNEWYDLLHSCVEHVHVADAAGATSEGLMFGEGIIGNFSDILLINKLKIIECWQGHINEGEGFKQALETLFFQSNGGSKKNA